MAMIASTTTTSTSVRPARGRRGECEGVNGQDTWDNLGPWPGMSTKARHIPGNPPAGYFLISGAIAAGTVTVTAAFGSTLLIVMIMVCGPMVVCALVGNFTPPNSL